MSNWITIENKVLVYFMQILTLKMKLITREMVSFSQDMSYYFLV